MPPSKKRKLIVSLSTERDGSSSSMQISDTKSDDLQLTGTNESALNEIQSKTDEAVDVGPADDDLTSAARDRQSRFKALQARAVSCLPRFLRGAISTIC